nr:hypothetical protein [Rhodococcus qingshengii]
MSTTIAYKNGTSESFSGIDSFTVHDGHFVGKDADGNVILERDDVYSAGATQKG